jgi:hypothetical protein
VAIPAFGFSRYSPALSLLAVKGEVEGPLFTRHFFVACPLPTIPHGISLCLRDSVAITAFGFSRHTPLAPRHCNSNRHKHGLEMPVTPVLSTQMSFLIATDLGGAIASPERKFFSETPAPLAGGEAIYGRELPGFAGTRRRLRT